MRTQRLCVFVRLLVCRGQNIGAAGTPLLRSTFAVFADGHDAPTGASRPNPRVISNAVAFQDPQADNDRDMSTLAYIWGQVSLCAQRGLSAVSVVVAWSVTVGACCAVGEVVSRRSSIVDDDDDDDDIGAVQFLDHDITLVDSGTESLSIPVPKVRDVECSTTDPRTSSLMPCIGACDCDWLAAMVTLCIMRVVLCAWQGDAVLDPTGTGTKVLPFTRSATVRSTDGHNTREAVNSITHFIDGSMVSEGG